MPRTGRAFPAHAFISSQWYQQFTPRLTTAVAGLAEASVNASPRADRAVRATATAGVSAVSTGLTSNALPATAQGTGIGLAPSEAAIVGSGRATGTGAVQSAAALYGPLARYHNSIVQAGVTNVFVLGDSIGEGVGCGAMSNAGYINDGFVWKLGTLLQTRHAGAGGVGFVNIYSRCFDHVISPAAGGTVWWTSTGGGTTVGTTKGIIEGGTFDEKAFGGRTYNPVANEVITLHYTGTGFTLQYSNGALSGIGSFTVKVDSGSPVTVNPTTTGAVNYQGQYTPAVTPSHGSHTVVITPASGKIAYVRGATVYDGDDTAGIRIFSHTLGASTTFDDLTTNGMCTTAGLTDQLTVCPDPALVIIERGVNDYQLAATNATDFKTNLQTDIANIKARCSTTPSFLLLIPYEVSPLLTPLDTWANFVQAMKDVASADSSNVTYIDFTALLPGVPDSGNGYFGGKINTDRIHPTTAGHLYIAQQLDSFLV